MRRVGSDEAGKAEMQSVCNLYESGASDDIGWDGCTAALERAECRATRT